MKFNKRRISAWIASIMMIVCVIAGSVVPASAASTGYFKSYSNIAAIKNSGKCGIMQGMAVGSTYLYTVKINSANDKAFISKTNKNTGETSVLTDTSTGSINLTKAFSINISNVMINGKSNDLSAYIHQGYSYYKGKIFVPLTGPDGKKNVSVIAVYNVDGASGTIKSDANLSFRITSSTYAPLFEIESCGISSDGKLYFNTNRRKSATDTDHDAILVFKDYTF